MGMSIPLFPLNSVLFPQGVLPLRIFEPRYLDMVSRCMKTNSGFGVCLIREGAEVGSAAQTFKVGTLGEINYFERRSDGLLGITVEGKQRFNVISSTVQSNQLLMADVELLPQESTVAVPQEYSGAAEFLDKAIQGLGYPFSKLQPKYHDASWVSSRLIEILPIELSTKQQYLQSNDPLERLAFAWRFIVDAKL